VTRDLTLDTAIADAGAIRLVATECLKRIELQKSIRLLGVKATALTASEVAKRESPWSQSQFDFQG
jgi:DNA polymerase-4